MAIYDDPLKNTFATHEDPLNTTFTTYADPLNTTLATYEDPLNTTLATYCEPTPVQCFRDDASKDANLLSQASSQSGLSKDGGGLQNHSSSEPDKEKSEEEIAYSDEKAKKKDLAGSCFQLC